MGASSATVRGSGIHGVAGLLKLGGLPEAQPAPSEGDNDQGTETRGRVLQQRIQLDQGRSANLVTPLHSPCALDGARVGGHAGPGALLRVHGGDEQPVQQRVGVRVLRRRVRVQPVEPATHVVVGHQSHGHVPEPRVDHPAQQPLVQAHGLGAQRLAARAASGQGLGREVPQGHPTLGGGP